MGGGCKHGHSFFPGILTGDCGSFGTNHPPTTSRVTRDIQMVYMSAHGYYSDLSSLSVDTSKHTKTLLYIVIGQDGDK